MNHPAHDHRFDVVYEGSWYWLASLSEHIRNGVEPAGDKSLLLDRMYHQHIVPKSKVHIPPNPLP